ncbi:Uncharacterised protein [Salmonella enterica]|nr:Uncharacterised protein [Salmonella enterica]
MPTIILCKRANPVLGVKINYSRYNIRKNTY